MKLKTTLPVFGLLTFLCICIYSATAQVAPARPNSIDSTINSASEKSNSAIQGYLIDSATKKPISFGKISLSKDTGEPITVSQTKDDGSFLLDNISLGKFILKATTLGYSEVAVPILIDTSKRIFDIGKLSISFVSKQLNEVAIVAQRQVIKMEVDRIAYDVQADPQNKIQSVLDMLQKVPLVSVDGEDNIRLKGNSNYKILIDGRTSSLVANNPRDVLKSMPASNILRIEVITTPPAKYDSEGLAGIINIITNRKIGEGYNASITSRLNLSGPINSAFLAVKSKKVGFTINGGSTRKIPRYVPFSNSRTNFIQRSQYEQSGERAYQALLGYLTSELSYEIDSLNLIAATIAFNSNHGGIVNTSNNENSDYNNILIQSYRLRNDVVYHWGGFDIGINYQLGFKKNKDRLLTASYNRNSNRDDQDVSNTYSGMTPPTNYLQQNYVRRREQTAQFDYTHPIKNLTIEGGVKAILRESDSKYGGQEFDPATGNYLSLIPRTNNFEYHQNVLSLYNSYQVKWKTVSVKGGVRLEKTLVDANFESIFNPLKINYQNVIPAISLQKKISSSSSLTLGYTQRILRPDILQLNPFKDIRDKFVTAGNPKLQPVLSNNFDFNFSVFKKASITAGLSYSFANNTIQNVSAIRADTTYITYQNIGKSKNLGFNLSTNYPFSSKFSLLLNCSLSYLWVEGFVDSRLYKNSGTQGYTYIYATYKFKNDWRAAFNAGYYSPTINLQGQSNFYYYTLASVSKDFMSKKGNIALSVGNPFRLFRSYTEVINSSEFTQSKNYAQFYRQMELSISYKFGRLKDQQKKNKRSIKNDDTSGSKSRGDQ